MDKKILSLLGAVSAFATAGVANASTTTLPAAPHVLQADTFAGLLTPIPNAAPLLRSMDESRRADAATQPEVQLAQYYDHHHHHHHYYVAPRRHYYHHHHHHHYYAPPVYHHHHQYYEQEPSYQAPSYQAPSYDHEGY